MIAYQESKEAERLKDQEIYAKVKRFKELSSEEIDVVAAKIRRISPKYEDLFRPEIMETQEWLEYEQEVERIATRRENV